MLIPILICIGKLMVYAHKVAIGHVELELFLWQTCVKPVNVALQCGVITISRDVIPYLKMVYKY